jgi:hypothetical protein
MNGPALLARAAVEFRNRDVLGITHPDDGANAVKRGKGGCKQR